MSVAMSVACHFCHLEAVSKTCSGCLMARYCSKECQIKAWKTHKPHCKTLDSNASRKEKKMDRKIWIKTDPNFIGVKRHEYLSKFHWFPTLIEVLYSFLLPQPPSKTKHPLAVWVYPYVSFGSWIKNVTPLAFGFIALRFSPNKEEMQFLQKLRENKNSQNQVFYLVGISKLEVENSSTDYHTSAAISLPNKRCTGEIFEKNKNVILKNFRKLQKNFKKSTLLVVCDGFQHGPETKALDVSKISVHSVYKGTMKSSKETETETGKEKEQAQEQEMDRRSEVD
jgi:hypothetical protein